MTYSPIIDLPDGRRLVRVTAALDAAGLVPPMPNATDYHFARGTAVHEAVRLDAAGRLDAKSVHPDVAPYLESWRAFQRATRAVTVIAEREVRHESAGYAGRLDAVMVLGSNLALVDFKCGAPADWHRIQTALYFLALRTEAVMRPTHRGAIYLHGDGRIATFAPHPSPADFADGLRAVQKARAVLLTSRPISVKSPPAEESS